MYITENQDLGDSVLFLLAARRTLAEMVEDSGTENADVMVEFLMNEASDYEIMSLLVDGKLPDEKYDTGNELLLFSRLKESVLVNYGVLSEAIGEDILSDFMQKVNSVHPTMSTAGPVLEFFANQDREVLKAVIVEAGETATMGTLARKKIAAATLPAGTHTAPKAGGFGPTGTSSAQAIAQNKGVPTTPDIPQTPMGGETPGWQIQLAKMKHAVDSAVGTGTDAVKGTISQMSGTEQAIAASALAALLAYAASKVYKRFLSQAAKACKGQSGAAKTACMKQYKAKALKAQAADLQKGLSACSKAKNPASCKARVTQRIQSLQRKAAALGA